jgi:hypothetical protein
MVSNEIETSFPGDSRMLAVGNFGEFVGLSWAESPIGAATRRVAAARRRNRGRFVPNILKS